MELTQGKSFDKSETVAAQEPRQENGRKGGSIAAIQA